MARLVYVMGPSGAGKDTLINYARSRVDPSQIAFAHRYITRPPDQKGENHIAVSEAEFSARREAGFFAIWWASHGFSYAIGSEIEIWLKRGLLVVVSGSRSHWDKVRSTHCGAKAIFVSAPPHILAERLAARGRDPEAAIQARLERYGAPCAGRDVHLLENIGPLEVAGDRFVSMLQRFRAVNAA